MCETTQRTYRNCAQCIWKLRFANKHTSSAEKFQKSLNWFHQMAMCWHRSACHCKIVANIRFQSVGCLPSIDQGQTSSYKMSKLSMKAGVHKGVIWHFFIHFDPGQFSVVSIHQTYRSFKIPVDFSSGPSVWTPNLLVAWESQLILTDSSVQQAFS